MERDRHPSLEKPIFFDPVSVQAVLTGLKTQTRRAFSLSEGRPDVLTESALKGWRPQYKRGDILWVREAWGIGIEAAGGIIYKADYIDKKAPLAEGQHWRPSMRMPRSVARLFLRVTDVRLERLQDISEGDAIEEGLDNAADYTPEQNIARFAAFWDSFSVKRGYGWDINPWVWAYTFERIKGVPKSGK